MKAFKYSLASVLFHITALISVNGAVSSESGLQFRTFIEDIIYIQHVGTIVPVCKRWTVVPDLIIEASSSGIKSFIQESFSSICFAANLSTESKLPFTVYVGTYAQLSKIAADKVPELKLIDQASWFSWNDDFTIRENVVFICTDKIPSDKLKSTILRTLLAGFGFTHSSSLNYPSNFSSTQKASATLTPLDKKILSFIYTQVPPGTDKKNFSEIVKSNWK
ncbi:MAG: hypothetical protein WCO60_19665 [Verrucomicrobiota bacterium]